MADLFWEYGVKDTILNMLVNTDAPTFSLAKAWAAGNSVRRYEVVARPTGKWRTVSGPQKSLEDQSKDRLLAEASDVISDLCDEIVSLDSEFQEVIGYVATLRRLATEQQFARDSRSDPQPIRRSPMVGETHSDPLHDTEQAMSRGWR